MKNAYIPIIIISSLLTGMLSNYIIGYFGKLTPDEKIGILIVICFVLVITIQILAQVLLSGKQNGPRSPKNKGNSR